MKHIVTQPEPQHHARCIAPTYRGTRCRHTAGSFGDVCTVHSRTIDQRPDRYDSALVEHVERARRRWMASYRRRMEWRRLDRMEAHPPNRQGSADLPYDRPVLVLVPVLVEGVA